MFVFVLVLVASMVLVRVYQFVCGKKFLCVFSVVPLCVLGFVFVSACVFGFV